MHHVLKSSLRRQERVLRSLFYISNGLHKNLRVDHHLDDYQRVKEVT